MRLVVDTNVIVSAALKSSSWPAWTLRWVNAHGGLLKSTETAQEICGVLRRPFFVSRVAPEFTTELHRIFAAAENVAIRQRVRICRDPMDDMFLELALNGRADVIITGDANLLELDRFHGIHIITPAAFGHGLEL